ncbi:hypothetical protein RF11_06785 [Thelohanellus kitauei]|uniref:Uncharacterized protein n=1 Tax=Thelohanellus kitauei TaxID=669202 RepID=A0A0C2MM86_THEKT|nr:hypothetical protein RF11_06785 [Thelohanellus kitauei]
MYKPLLIAASSNSFLKIYFLIEKIENMSVPSINKPPTNAAVTAKSLFFGWTTAASVSVFRTKDRKGNTENDLLASFKGLELTLDKILGRFLSCFTVLASKSSLFDVSTCGL